MWIRLPRKEVRQSLWEEGAYMELVGSKDQQRAVRRGHFCSGIERKEVRICNKKGEFADWRMRMGNRRVPI